MTSIPALRFCHSAFAKLGPFTCVSSIPKIVLEPRPGYLSLDSLPPISQRKFELQQTSDIRSAKREYTTVLPQTQCRATTSNVRDRIGSSAMLRSAESSHSVDLDLVLGLMIACCKRYHGRDPPAFPCFQSCLRTRTGIDCLFQASWPFQFRRVFLLQSISSDVGHLYFIKTLDAT